MLDYSKQFCKLLGEGYQATKKLEEQVVQAKLFTIASLFTSSWFSP